MLLNIRRCAGHIPMQAVSAPFKTNYALLLCIIASTFFINFQCILKPVARFGNW
jgi:hypothetical protein